MDCVMKHSMKLGKLTPLTPSYPTWGFWEEPSTVTRAGTIAGFLNASRSWAVACVNQNIELNHTCVALNDKIKFWMLTMTCVLPALSLYCREQGGFGEFLPARPCSVVLCGLWTCTPAIHRYWVARDPRAKEIFRTLASARLCPRLWCVRVYIFYKELYENWHKCHKGEQIKLNTMGRKSKIKQI